MNREETPKGPEAAPDHARKGKNLLLVEDDQSIRETLGSILEDEGYDISMAANGREALEHLAAAATPDLILLDLRMPVMDGWSFRIAQRRDSHLAPIPVVAMSADGTSAAQAISADAFLKKPLDTTDVLATIERVLAESARSRQAAHWAKVERLASLGRIAAGVGHEINNPLAFVLMNVTLANDQLREIATSQPDAQALLEGNAEHRVRELAELLGDSLIGLERIRATVRNLQNLSRRADDRSGAVNLERVLDESISMTLTQIQHRARLTKRYAQVPKIKGRADALGQVFLNLLVNASQAIPVGGAFGNLITVTTAFDGRRVLVEITDTGHGIAPDVLPHIFDPFFTTKSADEGTGLGLAICQQIVTDLEGQLTIESEVGRGTVCRLSFPPAADDVVTPPPRQAAVPRAISKTRARARILVIDDEERIVQSISLLLSKRHDVAGAQNARQAFELLERGERFDLVLCDLLMPNVGGAEVFEAFATRWPELVPKLVFMTGGTFNLEATTLIERTKRPILHKPFTPAELEELVDAHLDNELTRAGRA